MRFWMQRNKSLMSNSRPTSTSTVPVTCSPLAKTTRMVRAAVSVFVVMVLLSRLFVAAPGYCAGCIKQGREGPSADQRGQGRSVLCPFRAVSPVAARRRFYHFEPDDGSNLSNDRIIMPYSRWTRHTRDAAQRTPARHTVRGVVGRLPVALRLRSVGPLALVFRSKGPGSPSAGGR